MDVSTKPAKNRAGRNICRPKNVKVNPTNKKIMAAIIPWGLRMVDELIGPAATDDTSANSQYIKYRITILKFLWAF
jgi:hypothetical protein